MQPLRGSRVQNHSNANLDQIRNSAELSPQHWPIQPSPDGSTFNTGKEADLREDMQEFKDQNQATCEIWLLVCTEGWCT